MTRINGKFTKGCLFGMNAILIAIVVIRVVEAIIAIKADPTSLLSGDVGVLGKSLHYD
tara:strand:- start:589 stop:762 length:174 start_codon:yes stop_codon:yes gene_type:complete